MIIAEIGLNHLGSVVLANLYVEQLMATNIDAVTFQVREPEYYLKNSHLQLRKYAKICKKVKASGKKFGIAIADIDMVDYFEEIDVDFYKVIRNDMMNDRLIERLISTNKKLIISTGTCSADEIQNFIDKFKNDNITLNHTQLSYDVHDCNLSAIDTLRSKFNVDISYGSHCSDHKVLYMSLCYTPSDILFYVKGNSGFKYPDDKHAIALDDVHAIANNLKNLSKAIGSGIKNKMKIKIK
tara:strand:+ start:571 stop:1290 length:720 start_codon:yes stop_codon:yes gene_type:complete